MAAIRTQVERWRGAMGFTLFELIIALAVVGLIMGVVVGGMNRYSDMDMKKTCNKLASTIRYLYNKSATEKTYIRLVLDLDEQSYWVEATTDPFQLTREDSVSAALADQKKKTAKKEGAEEKSAAESAAQGTEDKGAKGVEATADKGAAGGPKEVKKLKPAEPKFTAVDSFLLHPTKLPDTVFFKDVQLEHRTGPVSSGKESIYFFPNGYVEHSVINFRDEGDEINYSLETNPVSGRVKIEDRYRQMGEQ